MVRSLRFALNFLEVALLSLLVFAARCANYQDVFVGRNVYFTDADCYARMTRVQMCAQHPGLILRHHSFENFPQGTTPHTTAPLDYLILALAILIGATCPGTPVRFGLAPYQIDLAGALISPVLALVGAWFLWWWTRRMRFRFRWVALTLYAISPILVHGTQLGRPDHQSLLMLLVTIAICAEWTLQNEVSISWSVVNGIAWALAVWVSAYEPLILFILIFLLLLAQDRHRLISKPRCFGWIFFAVIITLALLVEHRFPSFSILSSNDIFKNWSRTIGELHPLSPADRIWFRWAGYLLPVAPFLIWFGLVKTKADAAGSRSNRARVPVFLIVLLVATYFLTLWQARWAYFFILVFAIAPPGLLQPIELKPAVWIAFVISLFPIFRDWDGQLWPNEPALAARVERRNESVGLHELAVMIRSSQVDAFLAPWWLSPAIAYWSGQPGVAGSSHESLSGIADSARFFLNENSREARDVLANHRVTWVFAYDWERVAGNSAAILGRSVPADPLCRVIGRTPAHAPPYLIFSAQNGTGKLFRVRNSP